jgi:SprT-like family
MSSRSPSNTASKIIVLKRDNRLAGPKACVIVGLPAPGEVQAVTLAPAVVHITNRSPTTESYGELDGAFGIFNQRLFGGSLPNCLITLHRRRSAYGYFSSARFANRNGTTTDEIAMNPDHLRQRPDREAFSTLVHEMAHLWQHHFGKPTRNGYHNRQWAEKMEALGLMPSSTGAPGGARTGPAGLALHHRQWPL